MVNQDGVVDVVIGNQTEPTIAVRLADVLRVLTIFVLGR